MECVSTDLTSAAPAGRTRDVVERLAAAPGREGRLRHLEVLPARQESTADWPAWAHPVLTSAFGRRGVQRPWLHQVIAADAAHHGQSVVLATGTASGKSLAYQLPTLSAVLEARGTRGERGATVLYLAPTKALAHDQAASLLALDSDVRLTTHDGDSSRELRDWARDHGEYLLTNPDMLHRSLLPGHQRWAKFFAKLRYVVIDEGHHYRGVFGAHVAQVMRRLRRVAAMYGAEPTFFVCSATMAEPEVSARRLTGVDCVPVTTDHSPRGAVHIGLWEPPLTPHTGENGAPVRRAASTETSDLLADLVAEGVPTLAFVRSRRGVEHVAVRAKELLAEVDPTLPGQVAAYRGGYLPEERRALEAALREGRLTGLAATNALELGIDVNGLDAVLIAGFPGTRAAMWQQIGRAGRQGQDALAVLVARDDPMDTFLVAHPEALLGAPVEANVFDTDNHYVLAPHLCCAAHEAPLTEADLQVFGPQARTVVDGLTDAGLLRRRPKGWFWTDRARPGDHVDIRGAGGAQVSLVEAESGRVVGTVDGGSSHSTAHPGAIYLHRGETWQVEELDLEHDVAVMRRVQVEFSTQARESTEIEIVNERAHRYWGECRLSFGEVDVTHQVVSYLTRRQPSGDVVAETPLDLPERTLRTTAVWWQVPDDLLADAGLETVDLPGAAHAAEHCSIGLLPLFATCDRWDIGGVSTARHPDTGVLTVFVHDGHPGGAGFAERGYATAETWLRATRKAIAACECAEGCPSCVQSPKCGNQNNPLDKHAAIRLLDVLLAGAPRV
nr:DEAD/DEAH box helicase [Nocardioides yefusunii]